MSAGYPIGDGTLKIQRYIHKVKAEKILKKLENRNSDEYFQTDKTIATNYSIKTAMVKKIRDAGAIPIREDRILKILRTLPTDSMYLVNIQRELKNKLSYNTLYVLMKNNKIGFLRLRRISNPGE